MCGIVGYVGPKDCSEVLVNALTKLEYRGYDSAGIAVLENGVIKVEKCKGRLENLRNKMAADGKPDSPSTTSRARRPNQPATPPPSWAAAGCAPGTGCQAEPSKYTRSPASF